MRRYMKLIFKILEYTETSKQNGGQLQLPEFEEYTNEQVNYHARLCRDAGYINLDTNRGHQNIGIIELTWQGHEELDRMRKEGCCK